MLHSSNRNIYYALAPDTNQQSKKFQYMINISAIKFLKNVGDLHLQSTFQGSWSVTQQIGAQCRVDAAAHRKRVKF